MSQVSTYGHLLKSQLGKTVTIATINSSPRNKGKKTFKKKNEEKPLFYIIINTKESTEKLF